MIASEDPEKLLLEARQNALELLKRLKQDEQSIVRNSSSLAVQAVTEGRAAHAAAIDAARSVAENLERSLRAGSTAARGSGLVE